MAQKIYTKTGDAGYTSLIGGTKVSKSHLRIEAYGTLDELNSFLGLCRDLLHGAAEAASTKITIDTILEIQDRLFTIGSALAVDPLKEPRLRLPDLIESDVTLLETQIDLMNESLPPMKHFILPGGNVIVSHLHVTRCVCRRSERLCVRLMQETGEDYLLIVKYINRLSDYLFVLARFVSHLVKATEIAWTPRVSDK
jgi:cob(I)alamin adenosyltransferase